MRFRLFFITALFLLWQIAVAAPLAAQEAVPLESVILANETQVDFPQSVAFRLEIDPDYPLEAAALTYRVDRSSCLDSSTTVPIRLDDMAAGRLEWTWSMIRSGNPPPGARLWWEWTVTGQDGRTFTTPREELELTDNRFEWRALEAPGIRLHWYHGDQVGPILLEAAVAGLRQLETQMGIEAQSDVQFFIYGSSQAMREAALYVQEWAGGLAYTQYNVILMGVAPSQAIGWGQRTVRHELAHLIIEQFAGSCVGGSRPNWLEEGLAVYAEGEPEQRILNELRRATRDNSFEPLRSLNGPFSAHGPEAGIAYSQSYSVVAFMLEQYGQEKMRELLLTLAGGEGYDQALERVYGFNIDGLEMAWREEMGLPPREIPPLPTPILAAAIPTLPPLELIPVMPTPESAAQPPAPLPAREERPASGLCGGGLIPFFLLGIGGIAYGWGRRGERETNRGGEGERGR